MISEHQRPAACPEVQTGSTGQDQATKGAFIVSSNNKLVEIKGYAVVIAKVAFVTRVFKADGDEGFQFNIGLVGDTRLSPRFATRAEADLEHALLLEAIRNS